MKVNELILNIKQKRKFRGPRIPRKKGIEFHKLAKVRRAIKDDMEMDGITEAEAEGKNLHLTHFEDSLIHGGYKGAEDALNIAAGLLDMLEGNATESVNITTKWDGAPAIFAGINPETGKFIMGDKGLFAQTPRTMDTPDAIDQNKADRIKKGERIDLGGLRSKLKEVLEHLPKIFPSDYQGILQGDLLFTTDIKKEQEIDGEKYIAFTPNSLTYAVPVGSDIANQIEQAKIGIVFHTKYDGDTIPTMKASFGANVDDLKPNPDVWFRDAKIHDVSGQVTLTKEETNRISKGLNDAHKSLLGAGQKVFQFLESEEMGKDFKKSLEATINASIKADGTIPENPLAFASSHVARFEEKYEREISNAKRQDTIDRKTQEMQKGLDFFEANRENFTQLYHVWLSLFAVKSMFAEKMSKIRAMDTFKIMPNGDIEVRDPEGFVAVDHIGNAVKIVDRLVFSAENFQKSF